MSASQTPLAVPDLTRLPFARPPAHGATLRRVALIGILFALAKLVQVWFGSFFGAAGGLLLIAVSSVRRRVKHRSLYPLPYPTGVARRSPQERAAFYRHQARVAWGNGRITIEARLILNQLRDRLGLTASAARVLEDEAYRSPN